MEYVLVLVGVLIGSIITNIMNRYKCGYGRFSIIPVDEESGEYTINVSIRSAEAFDVDRIILVKDDSQQ